MIIFMIMKKDYYIYLRSPFSMEINVKKLWKIGFMIIKNSHKNTYT